MNLAHYLESSAQVHPHKTSLRFEGQQITFQELDIACNRLAYGLSELGLAPGDRCMVMMPNSIQQVKVYYALAKIGAIVVPVNFLFRQYELEHIIEDSQPKAFIGAKPYLDEIRRVLIKGDVLPVRIALGVPQDHSFINLENVYSDKTDFSAYPTDVSDF